MEVTAQPGSVVRRMEVVKNGRVLHTERPDAPVATFAVRDDTYDGFSGVLSGQGANPRKRECEGGWRSALRAARMGTRGPAARGEGVEQPDPDGAGRSSVIRAAVR